MIKTEMVTSKWVIGCLIGGVVKVLVVEGGHGGEGDRWNEGGEEAGEKVVLQDLTGTLPCIKTPHQCSWYDLPL